MLAVMRVMGLGLALAIVLGACTPSAQDDLDIVSDVLCRCGAFGPGAQDQCVTQVEAQLVTVSPDCVTCVEDEADDCPVELSSCALICLPQQEPGNRDPVVTKEAP
jgi:hypothetical protein